MDLGDHVERHQTAPAFCLAEVEPVRVLLTVDLNHSRNTASKLPSVIRYDYDTICYFTCAQKLTGGSLVQRTAPKTKIRKKLKAKTE